MSNFTKDIRQAQSGNLEAVMLKTRLERLFLEDRKTENRYGLHASAILSCDSPTFCYREQLLSLFYKQNQGEQLPIKSLKIFAQGNAMHEKWYNLFRKAGVDVAIERTLFLPEFDLSFTIDAIINFSKPKYEEYIEGTEGELVGDVKSMSTFQFRKRSSHTHPSGEKQVNFYLWALSYLTGKPHRKGFVLVDSKDDQEIDPVIVNYDKEKVRSQIACLKEIQVMKREFLENKVVPARLNICKNCDTKRASICAMRDACWNIGMGRVKLSAKERRRESKEDSKA